MTIHEDSAEMVSIGLSTTLVYILFTEIMEKENQIKWYDKTANPNSEHAACLWTTLWTWSLPEGLFSALTQTANNKNEFLGQPRKFGKK